MSLLRSDLWVSAFVRRHNNLGHICVVARRGDPVAGQIFVVQDHLDGTLSLYTPAPAVLRPDEAGADRIFERRFDHAEPLKVRDRITRELDFDPDVWVVEVDLRRDDLGMEVVAK